MEMMAVRDQVKMLSDIQAERNARTKKVTRNKEGKLEVSKGEG
jgi:ribosomal protein L33